MILLKIQNTSPLTTGPEEINKAHKCCPLTLGTVTVNGYCIKTKSCDR